MKARPSLSELQQFAALIGAAEKEESNSEVQPTVVDEASLDYHGITALALKQGRLSESLSAKLTHRIPLAVATEVLRRNALLELSSALSAAGLEPLLFKGSALAYQYYPEPWLRPRTDTDLLISPEHKDRYNKVFDALGYQKLFAIEGSLVSYQATYSKALSNRSGLNIDLHWKISNRQILAQLFNASDLMSRSPSEKVIGFKTLSLVDHVLVACQHRVGHHHREERLTWLYDIHLLLLQFDVAAWQQLTKMAGENKICSICLDALSVCSSIFGTDIPRDIQNTLSSQATEYEPSAIFLRRDIAEWQLFWYELAALPSFSQRIQWCQETLFPSAEYVRQQMQEESLLKAHLKRLWRGLKRVTT